jgi:uncharacterized protein
MDYVEWVVKPSTYCNLRCRYCYEWNGLSDRYRMPLDVWQRTARAICEYHQVHDRGDRTGLVTRVIWHGGEPFTLPSAYFETLLTELTAAARAAGIPEDRIVNCVQTNLTVLSERTLRTIVEHGLRLGISMDVVPGVRVDRAGQQTETGVLHNIETLRARGIGFGAITVLAKHTCESICDIYDFWARQGVNIRILPLFEGPQERDYAAFHVGEAELGAALSRLFDHHLSSPCSVQLDPLDEWLVTIVRCRLGISTLPYDRRRQGDSVFVVRPNGDVFQTNEIGDDALALGNLGRQTLQEMFASGAYEASLRRSEEISTRTCNGCRFRGGCDGYPAHAEKFAPEDGRRCPVAYRVLEHMDRALDGMALGAAELRRLADDNKWSTSVSAGSY